MTRPRLDQLELPKIPDSPEVQAAVKEAEKEEKRVMALAALVQTKEQGLIVLEKLGLAKIDWPLPELKEVVGQLERVLRSTQRVPMQTIQRGLRQVAAAIPRIRRAQAIRKEILDHMEACGVDMTERARLLDERKSLYPAALPAPTPALVAAPEEN